MLRTFSPRVAGLSAATFALSLLFLTAGTSHATTTAAPHAQRYRDYLGTTSRPATVTTSGADQCTKPATQRTGNWMCLNDATSPSTTRPASASPDQYCLGNNCWATVTDDYHSTYTGSGYFGINNKVLGSCNFNFTIALNGSQSTSKPVHLTCDTSINAIVFTGDRLYYSSAYPGGNTVDGGSQEKEWSHSGTVAAGTTALWPIPGYVGYEATVAHGGVVHEWSWGKPGYSGNWYAYAKSIKFDKTTNSSGETVYVFGADDYLGSSPEGSGYDS